MAAGPSTPPPPQRLHTPPTPLHGPRYDSWEPYSPPRRSKRVASKHCQSVNITPPSNVRHRARSQMIKDVTSTPRASNRPTLFSQSSHQTLSPPSSPETAQKAPLHAPVARSTVPMDDILGFDGCVDDAQASESALPTPRKTPRRKDAAYANSRTFPNKHYDSQRVFPTPKRRNRYTLDSPSDSPSASTTQVYIDSQDRQPEMEATRHNPFVGPRSRAKRERSQGLTNEEREMDELVKAGKGMIYTFRGKRLLRKFSVDPEDEDETEPRYRFRDQTSRIVAAAGPSAERPLTRSHLKPRLLFTDRDESLVGSISDEEALTDIEENNDVLSASHPEEVSESNPEAALSDGDNLPAPKMTTTTEETPSHLLPQSRSKGKKPSPFDSWPRQKPDASTRSTAGTKRSAPHQTEGESVGKRTRSSGAATGESMGV